MDQKYSFTKPLGQGAYGAVIAATLTKTIRDSSSKSSSSSSSLSSSSSSSSQQPHPSSSSSSSSHNNNNNPNDDHNIQNTNNNNSSTNNPNPNTGGNNNNNVNNNNGSDNPTTPVPTTKEVQVAIKKIPNAFKELMDSKRILRESKLMRHFRHPNVVGLKDLIPPPIGDASDLKDVYMVIINNPLQILFKPSENPCSRDIHSHDNPDNPVWMDELGHGLYGHGYASYHLQREQYHL